ncbi:hypothetical protein BVRB_039920, partial [Beta vulgaris subsp. vulgaris]
YWPIIDIVDIRRTKPDIILQRLVDLAATTGSTKEIVESLLDMDRRMSDSQQTFAILAVRFWDLFADSLMNERNLLLRLISLGFPGDRKHIENIIEKLSPSALSVSADDDTTALELYLGQ